MIESGEGPLDKSFDMARLMQGSSVYSRQNLFQRKHLLALMGRKSIFRSLIVSAYLYKEDKSEINIKKT